MCEAVVCVLSASRLGGKAHGANSCHGEMLTPLNALSSKQRRVEHMPRGSTGEKGELDDPADAMEKGELTSVK